MIRPSKFPVCQINTCPAIMATEHYTHCEDFLAYSEQLFIISYFSKTNCLMKIDYLTVALSA